MLADPHSRESERLKTLRDYEILDTSPEVEFDEITSLAARLTGCPIALISLVDEGRQWFKSSQGFEPDETGLDMAICAHAIITDDFLEIRDLTADDRTRDNPLVCAGPNARFYAGALLTAPNGLPIGTLCVMDYVPRELTPLQRDTLRVLSQQVMMRIEHKHALKTADLMRKEIDHRTKNSLQSVSSLIRLQRRAAHMDETRAALDKALYHIDSVATLHTELYGSDEDNKIELSRLTGRLVKLLEAQIPANVSIRVGMPAFHIDARRAASFGVLLNEFVSNSTKHAFPDGREGRITIDGSVTADGAYHLVLSDNGDGFADGSADNLGMKVLRGAALGMGCETVDMKTEGGVELSLLVPAVVEG